MTIEKKQDQLNNIENLFLSFKKGDLSIENLIKKIDFNKKNEVDSFYKKIENDSFFFSSVKEKLPLDKKIFILQNICDKVSDFNGADLDWKLFQKRHDLKEKIFSPTDEIDWLKQMAFNKQNEPNHWRNGIIRKIEKYFRVTDIITKWLGYNRNEIVNDNKIKNQVTEEVENNKSLYEWVVDGHINTQIGRAFLLRFLNAWKDLQRMTNTWTISEETKNLLRKYCGVWWRFVWLIQTLSYLDESSQEKINSLDEAWLIIFLDTLSNDKEIWDKIKNIMGYERSLETANRVVQLLVTETAIQNVIKRTETEIFENPKFLESEEYKEIRSSALTWKHNTKVAQSLYMLKLDKEGSGLFLGLSSQEKKEKINEIWKSLSDQEKNIYQQQAWELNPKDSRLLLKTEYRLKIKERAEQIARKKLSNERWVNYDELSSFERSINVLDASYDETLNFSAKYLDEKTLIRKKEELEAVRDQNNQELFETANKYWFTEDLRQARWEEYYKNVEQQYLASYDQRFSQVESKYQESNLWKIINDKIFWDIDWNINNKNKIFGNRKISKETLKWWLSEDDYKKYFNEIYPNEKTKNTWEVENTKQEESEDSLCNDTNETIKKEFQKRIIYFLWDCLNIKLDNSWKGLFESITFDGNVVSSKDGSSEISLVWTYDNKKIRIYYDIGSWNIKIWKYLHFDNSSKSVNIDKNFETLKSVKWPRIDDFYSQANNISYDRILRDDNVKSSKDFELKVIDQLKIVSPIENQSDFAKQEIETELSRTIVAQKVFDMVLDNNKTEDWKKNNNIEDLFSNWTNEPFIVLLTNSLYIYNKNQLKNFENVIDYMKNYKLGEENTYLDNKPITNISHEKAKEQTRILLSELDKEKNKWGFAWEVLNDFFSAFSDDKFTSDTSWEQKIINIEKLLTYYEDLSWTNKTDKETPYLLRLEADMSKHWADRYLDKSLASISSNNLA